MSWKDYNGGDEVSIWHVIGLFVIMISFFSFIFFFGGPSNITNE